MFENIYNHLLRQAKHWNRIRRSARGTRAYSQEGEDLIIDSLFFRINGGARQDRGFYVDVGAHHPFTYSNTARVFKRGWRGINIDPSEEAIRLFDLFRPRDTNLRFGVGKSSNAMTYFKYDQPAFNTFSTEVADQHAKNGMLWKETETVAIKPLRDILQEHVPAEQKIDFLNVDVEGFDLDVLKSNDWDLYKPGVIAIEQLGKSLNDVQHTDAAAFLKSAGYIAWCKSTSTVFYVDADVSGKLT